MVSRLFLSTCLVGVLAASAQSYTIGGVNTGWDWGWHNIGMTPFRGALENPARFGPSGLFKVPVSTTLLSSISPASLATVDCFISPATQDPQLSAQNLQDIRAFFLAGGDLILLNDGPDWDAIGANLGFPSQTGNTSSSNGTPSPIFQGAFGFTNVMGQRGLVGWLTPSQITNSGGIITGSNGVGVTSAYWPAGAYAPGAGKIILVADVDAFAASDLGYTGMADYTNLNSNARQALNSVAYLIGSPFSATATLDGYQPGIDDKPMTVQIWQNGTMREEKTVTGGSVSFDPAVTGVVRLKFRSWTSITTGVTVDLNGNVPPITITMTNGDIDGDDEVGPGDFAQLAQAFLSADGDPNWNIRADLDGDGEVGPGDFDILASSFLQSGD